MSQALSRQSSRGKARCFGPVRNDGGGGQAGSQMGGRKTGVFFFFFGDVIER